MGSSMEPNYYQGDIAISTNLLEYDYGDVVTAEGDYGSGYKPIIKRVIGLPGDTIERKEGIIYLNNAILDEDYETVYDNIQVCDWSYMCNDNEYFLMGDNRPYSDDSRHIGPISKINGKIIVHIPTGKLLHNILKMVR